MQSCSVLNVMLVIPHWPMFNRALYVSLAQARRPMLVVQPSTRAAARIDSLNASVLILIFRFLVLFMLSSTFVSPIGHCETCNQALELSLLLTVDQHQTLHEYHQQ